MKNKKNAEMWKKALENIDEKYIAEAAEYAPAPTAENHLHGTIKKGKTGNLAFALSAAAVVAVSLIGVGFLLKGTGIEPLSPSSGTIGTSNAGQNDAPVSSTTAVSGGRNMTTTILMDNNGEITTVISGEYSKITTAVETVRREQYENWFSEAEKIKAAYLRQIEVTQKEISECEKHIAALENMLETEKFEEKKAYDDIKADITEETINLAQLQVKLEQLEADYYEQVLLIEQNRKVYEELYPSEYQYIFEAFLEYDENNPAKVISFSYKGGDDPITLAIPEGVTEIGEDVFADCTRLEAVTLPSTLEVIGTGAFKNCTNLKTINIPYGVKEIGAQAFANCISMPATLTLPDTVTVIGDGAFAGCTQFDGTCKPAVIKPDDFSIICPVDNPFITTEYTGTEEKAHSGIDYAAELGSNIYAAADGVVTSIVNDYKDGYDHGKYIIIDHGSGFSTFYSHLDSIAVNINDQVSAGDIIGYMGCTGWATGPHLHFELIKDGETVNPQEYLK